MTSDEWQGVSREYSTLASQVSPQGFVNNDGFTQGNGFSVYNPAKNSDKLWPTTTQLQKENNSSTYTQVQIMNEPPNPGKLEGNPKIKDFRKTLILGGSISNYNAPNYSTKNIEKG